MAKYLKWLAAVVFVSTALVSIQRSASATAFAGVNSAFWQIVIPYEFSNFPFPDGILATCGAAPLAPITNPFFCSDFRGGSVSLSTPGSLTFHEVFATTISFNNPTDHEVAVEIGTRFSGFNPGGSPIGASVDNPLTETAEYSSSVQGLGVGDFHACATSVLEPQCGVGSPDDSQSSGVFFLGSGQSGDLTYTIEIFAHVTVVPEPAMGMTILLGGFLLRGRRSPQRPPLSVIPL